MGALGVVAGDLVGVRGVMTDTGYKELRNKKRSRSCELPRVWGWVS